MGGGDATTVADTSGMPLRHYAGAEAWRRDSRFPVRCRPETGGEGPGVATANLSWSHNNTPRELAKT